MKLLFSWRKNRHCPVFLILLEVVLLVGCLSTNPDDEHAIAKLLENRILKTERILVLATTDELRDYGIEEGKTHTLFHEIITDKGYINCFPPLVIPVDWNSVSMTDKEKEWQRSEYRDRIAHATYICITDIHDMETIQTIARSLLPFTDTSRDEEEISITLSRGPIGHFLFMDKNDRILIDATTDILGQAYFFLDSHGWEKIGKYYINRQRLYPEEFVDDSTRSLIRMRRGFQAYAKSIIVGVMNNSTILESR